jgi:hypothetical protein
MEEFEQQTWGYSATMEKQPISEMAGQKEPVLSRVKHPVQHTLW